MKQITKKFNVSVIMYMEYIRQWKLHRNIHVEIHHFSLHGFTTILHLKCLFPVFADNAGLL
jgi:hypothetical protein